MTDSQRWDMLNCYRSTGLSTPHLDSLAAGGVRFDRAYTCQPVCGPARAAIFSGTYPHTNGSWSNNLPLGDGCLTVGQRLARAGIHTAYIGKWHLDHSDYFGTGRAPEGWDPAVWYDMRNYLEELSPEDRQRSRREETIQEDIPAEFTFGHRCSNRAIEFLRRHAAEDFLLVVSYDEPHHPFLCPREYYDRYANYKFPATGNVHDTLADKPEHHRVWAGERLHKDSRTLCVPRAAYFGSNCFVDHDIGRVLDTLNTCCPEALTLYTSDHGHMEMSHRLHIKGPAAYDEISRIPLIVRWPGHAPSGSVNPHPVSHVDITPSLLEFFGLPQPEGMEGQSLLGACRNPATRLHDAIFVEFGRYETDHDGFGGFEPLRCVFDGRWKLTVNLLTSDELYDLQNDPGETTNLINAPAPSSVRNALHDRLLDWMNETRDPLRGYHWHCRPWRTDAPAPIWHYTLGNRRRAVESGEPALLDYDTGLECAQRTTFLKP